MGGYRILSKNVYINTGNPVTKREQAEDLFRTLTNSSPVGIFIVQDGKFRFVNPRFLKYTYYSEEELIGMDSSRLILPEDREMAKENAVKMLKGKRSTPYEYRVMSNGGRTRWILETVSSINYCGKPAVLGNSLDITWHKRTEKMLSSSEKRFSKAMNTMPSPMVITRIADGLHYEVNDSYLKNFGYSRREVIGRTIKDLDIYVNPDDWAKMVQTLLEQGIVHNMETSLRAKSGEVRVVLLSADTIEVDNEQCLLMVINDITERKQMEKEMARLERLNLVGEMAAGIGHEIRNPMTTVRGFLQMLDRKKEYVQHKHYFSLMIEELDRANTIITEFLTMAKGKPVDLKPHDLNQIVQTLFPLIQADAMNSDKYIEAELTEIPDLRLDEKEIRQLILNLARNGLEAMAAGGKLTIGTFFDGEEVNLSIQDRGCGIEPDVLEKIGTPFFTTKDNGTGLGIAVCYSIAARHGATIDIETSPGGTTFFIRFRTQ